MRGWRGRGAPIEGRNEVRRLNREIAARDALIARMRVDNLKRFHDFVALTREMNALAADCAETLESLQLHQTGRLDAMSRVHTMIVRDDGRALDLETLVWNELSVAISPCEGERLTIDGPLVELEPRVAAFLALTLQELTTNAIKYGALSEDEGHVDVSWTISADPTPSLSLSWTESDAPPRRSDSLRRGFGCELIEDVLPRRLNASTQLSLRPQGLTWDIEVPLRKPASEAGAARAAEIAIAA